MRITVEAIENPQMGIYPSFFVSYDLCEKMHNLVQKYLTSPRNAPENLGKSLEGVNFAGIF